MTTLELTTTFQVIECANCGTMFALSDTFARDRRRDHDTFFCPRGHNQYFPGTSDLEAERKKAARAEQRLKYAEIAAQAARDQAKAAEYSARAQKAANTRLKNRIAKGICPCCKRNFANVREHIAGQHPDFVVPHE